MQCAANIFVNSGFDDASMEQIASAASVGKLAIYQIFAHKSDLFAAVIVRAVQEMAAPLREILRPDKAVEPVLIAFAERYLERMIRPVAGGPPFHAFAQTLVAAARTHPNLAQSCMAILKRDIAGPLTGYISAKIENGEMRSEDPEFLSAHLTQMLFFSNRVAMEPSACPSGAEIGEIARRVVKLFLHGSLTLSA